MDRNESWHPLEVSALSVHLAWASLEIVAEDVPELQLFVSGSDGEVNALRMKLNDGHLLVEQPTYGISTMNVMERHWLTIYARIPLSWKGAVDLSSTSGRLNARGLTGSDLKIDTVNGALNARDMHFITAELSTVNAPIEISGMEAEELSVRVINGGISISRSNATSIKLYTVNGDQRVSLNAPFDSVSSTTVMGSLRLEAPIQTVKLQRRAVSGRAHLWDVAEALDGPAVSMNTVNGDLEITGLPDAQQ